MNKIEIPDGWRKVRLNEEVAFERGIEPGSQSYNTDENGRPFIRVSDLTKRGNGVYADIQTDKICNEHDILLSLDGTPGIVVRRIKGIFSSGIRKVTSMNEKSISNNYIFYLLQSSRIQNTIKAHTTGATILHAGKSIEFMEAEIPQTLEEQQKIAAILTTIDKNIEKKDKIITKCEIVKKGLMQALLTKGLPGKHKKFKKTEIGDIPEGWEVKKLGELFILKSGSTPYRKVKKYYEDGIIPWVKTLDLNNDQISQTEEYISDIALRKTSCSINPPGSVLIAMYGGFNQIGRTGVLKIEATTNQAITALLPNPQMDSFFVNYCLMRLRPKWKRMATSSRKDPNITKKDISNFMIPIPQLDEQKEIVTILDNITKRIKCETVERSQIIALKKALLQKLLTGQIRVKVD